MLRPRSHDVGELDVRLTSPSDAEDPPGMHEYLQRLGLRKLGGPFLGEKNISPESDTDLSEKLGPPASALALQMTQEGSAPAGAARAMEGGSSSSLAG